MARTVEQYIYSNQHWDKELHKLREICNNSELTEEVKWGAPCYTLNGKNVIGINGFKSYVGIWFHQGVFLKDPHQLLEQSDDTTKGLRKMMFQSLEEIEKKENIIKEYVEEAIQNQKEGKEINISKPKEVILPTELIEHLDKNPDLKKAFEKFTPGKQREFADYITDAKQTATKDRRLKKISEMILDGIGLHDKYK
ncbi:YdeI/OmpD-associated family protein [Membranihabitans maritimus]|uniref:YdeI/OmpD-associated family protein n=1 Tax=Membranihabitans maritimus TaxID=2904244 RepID=UPI001F1D7EF9|nr:YdeI/OmpD-associated family protein [Membranihabitans maritimus]